jgi:hypothetical protein
MVSKEGELPSFQNKVEMFDGGESGQQLSVKRRISRFGGRQFPAEKSKGLPGRTRRT